MPHRLQLSRQAGYHLPEGAMKVDRSTRWGNPFVIGMDGTREDCLQKFETLAQGWDLTSLRGRDLACWCKPGDACHADILLRLANPMGAVEEDDYTLFLKAKVRLAESWGFAINDSEIHPLLLGHQRASVRWMVNGGRRACFASFGLGKSMIQLETVRITLTRTGGRGLIVLPLGVRQEFKQDAAKLGIEVYFIRRIQEAGETGIYLTNYETVRDRKLDPAEFAVVSLDEASCLRGFGGSKTFREFMALFTGDSGPRGKRNGESRVKYRYLATATPSPNDYIELLAYAAFLGIMDVGQAKTRFFKRDATRADHLTLHPHKEKEFWLWLASWGLFIQRPSDLGFSDEGYELPPIDIRWHEVPTDHSSAGSDKSGQGQLFRNAAGGIVEAAREKRDSLGPRLAKLMEIRAEDPAAHRILWHDLESEREAIEAAIPSAVSIYGSQDLDTREECIIGFSQGQFQELAAKPVIAGSGCNFQRHCHWAIYLGIGFKFNDLIQSIYRIQRYLQTQPVRIDLIYTEAERSVRAALERKWEQHTHMLEKMSAIIQEYGLSEAAMAQTLTRKLGVERVEIRGEGYELVNDDCIRETRRMQSDSVGLVLSSYPFGNQYEYSPNYADLGHTDDPQHFFAQLDFLTPELLRILMPGRVCAIHVKDRITPMGLSGMGFQTVYPFHADVIRHMTGHGFGFLGMKTIVTDVVRENNQTYRLGWSEQCKDGSKMGVGMPEYLLLFRKPPTSLENSYADVPVMKSKDRYTRSRWQTDAHGFARSAGNRLMTPDELRELSHEQIFRLFRDFSLREVYDFEHHVRLAEGLEQSGKLPTTFMLLQPQSWHDDVWTDITRMLTLNNAQSAQGREAHLCPLQFDIVDRVIEQFSNPGDLVLDPFGGLMTVPYRALRQRRRGKGIELSPSYFMDGAHYCRAAAEEMAMPDLFAAIDQPVA